MTGVQTCALPILCGCAARPHGPPAAEVRGALAILGCDPFEAAFAASGSASSEALDGLIQLALDQRNAARARKDFAAADAIRDQILHLGILIEDTPQGTRWSIQ